MACKRFSGLFIAAVIISLISGCSDNEFGGKTQPESTIESNQEMPVTIDDLMRAVYNASPGDTIVLKDGVYENVELTFTGHGTASDYITIRAESVGGVQFKNDSQIVFSHATYMEFRDFYFNNNIRQNNVNNSHANANILIKDESSYIKISNNKFYRSGNDNQSFGPLVFITGPAKYNIIEYNTFDESHGVSVLVKNGSTYNTIRRNHFKNIKPSREIFYDNNGMESILVGSQTDKKFDLYTIVEYNLFENVIGDGSEIISNKSSNNTYRYNTFRDSPSMLTLRFGDDCKVEGNFFFNTKGGIRTYGSGHLIINNYIQSALSGTYYASIKLGHGGDGSYDAANNAKVINNTIINPTKVAIMIGRISKPAQPVNVLIMNNLIYTDNGTAILQISNSAIYKSNIFHLTEKAVPGLIDEGNKLTTVDIIQENGMYRPTVGSAVVDAGTADSNISIDMDGQARIDNPDIGADEISTEGVKNMPLNPDDVGCNF